MKILLVTEKYEPEASKRDGGSRIVNTLNEAFGEKLSIMQFGSDENHSAKWNYAYPNILDNRFEQRIANADFIAQKIIKVQEEFTHIIFIHISMQFGIANVNLRDDLTIWTFPMFLSPSYKASGELVREEYVALEKLALAQSDRIITPSHYEKEQLLSNYYVPEEKIYVVPRGIDTNFLYPEIRSFSKSLKICNIGSIKPQKNTIELVELFYKIQKKFPEARLKIIGPIQNDEYYQKVSKRIDELGHKQFIDFVGYVGPEELFEEVQDCHIHISRSNCETFGRSIFETLACGIPNIAKKTCNAAAEFLDDKPYVKFTDTVEDSLGAITEILEHLPQLSSMAMEVGKLYDDKVLSNLLVARICNKEVIAISDFDGTLFHKGDEDRTKLSIEEFKNFPLRVICSARSAEDLLDQLNIHNLEVDWIIAYSGAIVTDGEGNIIWSIPINVDDKISQEVFTRDAKKLEADNEHLQISISDHLMPHHSILNKHNLRHEIYDNKAYIANIEASKLHAIHRLLKHINWSGQVKVFGNGRYDMEMIKYFDGVKISA